MNYYRFNSRVCQASTLWGQGFSAATWHSSTLTSPKYHIGRTAELAFLEWSPLWPQRDNSVISSLIWQMWNYEQKGIVGIFLSVHILWMNYARTINMESPFLGNSEVHCPTTSATWNLFSKSHHHVAFKCPNDKEDFLSAP